MERSSVLVFLSPAFETVLQYGGNVDDDDTLMIVVDRLEPLAGLPYFCLQPVC